MVMSKHVHLLALVINLALLCTYLQISTVIHCEWALWGECEWWVHVTCTL